MSYCFIIKKVPPPFTLSVTFTKFMWFDPIKFSMTSNSCISLCFKIVQRAQGLNKYTCIVRVELLKGDKRHCVYRMLMKECYMLRGVKKKEKIIIAFNFTQKEKKRRGALLVKSQTLKFQTFVLSAWPNNPHPSISVFSPP